MLIEDIQRTLSSKEVAYRIQQLCQMNYQKSLRDLIDGNIYWMVSNRQATRPTNGIGKMDIRNPSKELKTPEVIFNEIENIANDVHGCGVLSALHITNDSDRDLVVLVPDKSKRVVCTNDLMRSLYKKNIELTTRLIERLSQRHNRMKVASIASKIDVFGSAEDRIIMSKDLTQIIVGVKQLCPDDADLVITHYLKPLERAIRNAVEKLSITTDETGSIMYVQCTEAIVIDTRLIDIEEVCEALNHRI